MRCRDEVDHINRQELLTEAARVAVQVDLHTAVRLLEEAKSLTNDTADAARIAAELGRAYGDLLEPESATTRSTKRWRHLPADDEDDRRRVEATLLVGAFVVPGRVDAVRRLPALKELPPHDSLGGRMLQAAIAEHEMAECDPRVPRERGRRWRTAGWYGRPTVKARWSGLAHAVGGRHPAAMASLDDSISRPTCSARCGRSPRPTASAPSAGCGADSWPTPRLTRGKRCGSPRPDASTWTPRSPARTSPTR